MAKKFTFKYEARQTGLAAIGNSLRSSDIKINGKVCGKIIAPNWRTPDNLYRVQFAVVDDICGFKWITLKHKDADEKTLRVWLNKQFDEIISQFDLHAIEH